MRVAATEETRAERITAREPEGKWREFGLYRSRELDEILEGLDLDDAVVTTDAASREEVARQVLDAAGWWIPGTEALAQ